MALPRVCSIPTTATTSMAFTQAQFEDAVESCPEVKRLRAIEAAAVAYRDAKNALRLALIRGDDSGPFGRAAAATETALFCLLTPPES